MARTDGTEYVHDDPRRRKDTDYDLVWKALKDTPITMMGDHEFMGQVYDLYDANDMKVGTVNFRGDNMFLGATFYGDPFVVTRSEGRREAIHNLLRKIEETHG